MTSDIITTVGFTLMGGLFIVIASFTFLRNQRLRRNGKLASAVVIRLDRRESFDSDGICQVYFYPVFRFEDEAGVSHVVHSPSGSSPAGFSSGQAIRVMYDPAKPSDAVIDSFGQLWLVPILFGIAGPLMLAFGAYLWWSQLHQT